MQLVDPTTGIIKRLVAYPRIEGLPPLHIVMAEFVDPIRLSCAELKNGSFRLGQDNCYAHGASVSRQRAIQAAIGEALERFSGHLQPQHALTRASFNDLEDALDLRCAILFPEEFYAQADVNIARFDPNRIISWLPGRNLTTGRAASLPASLVVLGFKSQLPDDVLDLPTSSGLAAGTSDDGAILSALLELIERDGFMCHWNTRATPPCIDVEQVSRGLGPEFKPFLVNRDIKLDLKDITTDNGIPSVLAILSPRYCNGLALGASSRPNLLDAAQKAIEEAYHTLTWVGDLSRSGAEPVSLSGIVDFKDHVDYYRRPEARSLAAFLLAETGVSKRPLIEQEPAEPSAMLNRVIECLRQRGLSVYAIDLTPDYVRNLGFSVQRVLVPGLQPLTCGPKHARRDSRRLASFWKATQIGDWCYNADPHPFP